MARSEIEILPPREVLEETLTSSTSWCEKFTAGDARGSPCSLSFQSPSLLLGLTDRDAGEA